MDLNVLQSLYVGIAREGPPWGFGSRQVEVFTLHTTS